MWEPERVKRYQREIAAIGNAVTDPEDIAVLIDLEAIYAEARRTAVLKLKNAGYSNREIARATGVTEGAVRKWIKKGEPST